MRGRGAEVLNSTPTPGGVVLGCSPAHQHQGAWRWGAHQHTNTRGRGAGVLTFTPTSGDGWKGAQYINASEHGGGVLNRSTSPMGVVATALWDMMQGLSLVATAHATW